MKITCEHCGTLIDTEKDKKCPGCHAPYRDNKEYKKVKEINDKKADYDLREREADIRKKEIENDILESQTKTVKRIKTTTIISLIIFTIIFLFVIYGAIKIFTTNKPKEIFYNNNLNEIEEQEEQPITVSFKETATMNKYDIKCDDIREYKYDWYEKGNYRDKNVKYYAFHIIFNDKSNFGLTLLNEIKLTYTDDKGNENISAKTIMPNTKESSSSLPHFTKSNDKVSGNIFFEIPNYVKDIKIKFKKVTINIKNFRKK